MSGSCIPVEHLGRVAKLPKGDPARAHLDACARCRSLLAMLAEFESPAAPREGARIADAGVRLRGAIAELTDGEPEPVAPAPRTRRRTAVPPWWRARFAFAALAVVVAAGTLVVRGRDRAPRMREAAPDRPAASAFAATPARAVAGGAELSWTARPGAERYRVVFFDASLREVARVEAGAATVLVLRAAALPHGLAHGQVVGWQVEALAGDDLAGRTAPRTLQVP